MARGPLWEPRDVGEWTDASPPRLHALFELHRTVGLAGADREEYARLLMHVVAIQFNHHRLHARLPEVRLVPEQVAADAVAHLVRKTAKMVPQAAGWRPMLAMMNTTAYRLVLTAVADERRKGADRVVAATDYYDPAKTGGGTDGRADPAPDPAAAAAAATPEGLRALLTSDDAEDAVLGDVVTASAAEAEAAGRAFRLLRDRLLAGRGTTAHADLPPDVRTEINVQLHGLIASRLWRLVRRYAG